MQTFSLPNRTARKAPGISGQSSVQSLMGRNSKARNISGFHITEVMINTWGYTSLLPVNSMFWSDCNVFYCSILAGCFLRVGGRSWHGKKSFCQQQSIAVLKTLDAWAKRQHCSNTYLSLVTAIPSEILLKEIWNWLQLGSEALEEQKFCCIFQYWQKNISRAQEKQMYIINECFRKYDISSIGPCFLEEPAQKAGVGTRGPFSDSGLFDMVSFTVG